MKKYGRVQARRVELPMSREYQDVVFEDLKFDFISDHLIKKGKTV